LIEQKDQRLSLKQSSERKKEEEKSSVKVWAESLPLFLVIKHAVQGAIKPYFSLSISFDCVAISNKAPPPPSVVGRRFSYSTRNLIVKKRSKHNRGKRVDQDILV